MLNRKPSDARYRNPLHPSPFTLYSHAFTLAEILITLGIIGIVAALTIPVLINQIQNSEYKSAWKKAYASLEQVSRSYLQENSTFQGASDYANILKSYYKTSKYCGTSSSTEGCWVPSGQTLYLDGTVAGTPDDTSRKDIGWKQGLTLIDGTTITTQDYWKASCNFQGSICGWILFDVNGFNAPNTVGRDVFGVWVFKDKVLPIGIPNYQYENNGYPGMGYGLSSKVLYQ